MLSSEIYFKVIKKTDKLVDINGFRFYSMMCLLPREIECQVLFTEKHYESIEENCYYTVKGYLTSNYDENNKDTFFSFRVYQKPKIIEQSEFLLQTQTRVRFSAFINKKYSKGLIRKGPEQFAFYSISVRVKNELGKNFNFKLLGYRNKALELDALPNLFYANVTGFVAEKREEWHSSSIVFESIIVKKEVENNERSIR